MIFTARSSSTLASGFRFDLSKSKSSEWKLMGCLATGASAAGASAWGGGVTIAAVRQASASFDRPRDWERRVIASEVRQSQYISAACLPGSLALAIFSGQYFAPSDLSALAMAA